MKLNAEIILDNLQGYLPAKLMGTPEKVLHLRRPEYYVNPEQPFLRDHLYVAKAEHLPKRPVIEPRVVIICVGNSMYLPYYSERCCLIQISERVDYFLLLNMLTNIYDKYDGWSEKLNQILNENASIKEMADCSREIFENPIFVLDANFHFLAYTDCEKEMLNEWEKFLSQKNGHEELELPLLGRFLELDELSTEIREPILFNILDSSTLSVNLFEDETYNGCLTIDYQRRKYRNSDNVLAEYLARKMELALRKYSANINSETNMFRQILQDIIDGFQLDSSQRRVLSGIQGKQEYICVRIKLSSRLVQLPIGYMCSMLEKEFPNSVVFEHDRAIVGFIETKALKAEGEAYYDALHRRMSPLLQSMNFKVGISDSLQDIYSARLYYLQASAALENGRIFAPSEHCYLFRDYALTELIMNALGKLPIEMYYSEGLHRLAEHDASSSVSYIETLRTYLNNNMSITKTTSSLYLNRSTLLERISRIKRELGIDLQDSDERLMLQILLKANEISEHIQEIQKSTS